MTPNRITPHHILIPGIKWDNRMDCWVGYVKVLYMDKCIWVEDMRRRDVARDEALERANQWIKEIRHS